MITIKRMGNDGAVLGPHRVQKFSTRGAHGAEALSELTVTGRQFSAKRGRCSTALGGRRSRTRRVGGLHDQLGPLVQLVKGDNIGRDQVTTVKFEAAELVVVDAMLCHELG